MILKRIAAALERMAPTPARVPRRVEFSVATDEDFTKGYDARISPSQEADE